MASLRHMTGTCSRCSSANRELLIVHDPPRGNQGYNCGYNHYNICAECVCDAQPVAQVAASRQSIAVATAVAGFVSEKEQQAAALQREVEELRRQLEAQQQTARTAAAETEELRDKAKELKDDLAMARAELNTQSREKLALEERVGSLRAELEGALQRSARLEAESGELQRLQHEMESRGICEEHRRQNREEAQRDLGPLDFYGIVIDMQRLRDVFGPGFPVCFKEPLELRRFTTPQPVFTVSVLGDFNVGKSWILSKLGGHTFQSGMRVHTKGISVKLINVAERQAATEGDLEGMTGRFAYFLDSQGLNSPVTEPPETRQSPEGRPESQAVSLERSLQETKAIEEFQRQVVLSISDVFLFVIGEMSAKNQLDLHLLYKAISEMREKQPNLGQRIIVVHNLRYWTHNQLVKEKYVDRVANIYSDRQMVRTPIHEDFVYLSGEIGDKYPLQVEHYFLTKEGDASCRNDLVFQHWSKILDTQQRTRGVTLSEKIREAMGRWLPAFLMPSGTSGGSSNSEVVLMEREVQEPEAEENLREAGQTLQWYTMSDSAYTIRTKPLGSIVSFASDGLAYNISKVPCEVENGTRRRSAKECRLMSIVNIEIPGLVLEGFKCWANHKTACAENGKANLVVKTQRCDVSKQEEVRIELRAELISTPSEFFRGQSSMGNPADEEADIRKPWVTFTEFSMGDVTCYGGQYKNMIHERGRRLFDRSTDGPRQVRWDATFATSDLLWDDSKPPLFCYSGGVLSIGFPCKDLLTDADKQTYVNSSAREPESES